jgi:hypothetical protein
LENSIFHRKRTVAFRNSWIRNNEGLLDQSEREELEALVELSEQLSLVRAEALQILGKRP